MAWYCFLYSTGCYYRIKSNTPVYLYLSLRPIMQSILNTDHHWYARYRPVFSTRSCNSLWCYGKFRWRRCSIYTGIETQREFGDIQYILRNMHTVFALLCFVVVLHWLIFPYPSGLLHWHCDNLTIAPVPAKQPWWIWINTSCEFIMNDCIITTKQSTTKPCAYFLGYTVWQSHPRHEFHL